MIDVIEALADLVAGDATIDPAYTQPFEFEIDKLYLWEEDRSHRSIGTGEVREDFTIVAVYVTDNGGETAVALRSPEVTRKIDAWATAAMNEIREHEGFGPWSYISASTDADFLRQLYVRGAALRITGYRVLD